jgi:hypothetical protein
MELSDVKVGTPASVVYPHDLRAAVVVRRTAKRVVIARVPVGPSERVDGGTDCPPITEAQGITDRPIAGTEVTYTLRTRRDGSVYADRADGGRITFGISVDRVNYQNW